MSLYVRFLVAIFRRFSKIVNLSMIFYKYQTLTLHLMILNNFYLDIKIHKSMLPTICYLADLFVKKTFHSMHGFYKIHIWPALLISTYTVCPKNRKFGQETCLLV